MPTCLPPSRPHRRRAHGEAGGSSDWGAFYGWLHEDGAFWQLCGKSQARQLGELIDPYGNDVSWAYSGKFWMMPLPAATCEERFGEAAAYLQGGSSTDSARAPDEAAETVGMDVVLSG